MCNASPAQLRCLFLKNNHLMIRFIQDVIFFVWELPQILIGAVVAIVSGAAQPIQPEDKGEWVAGAKWWGGAISLSRHFRIFSKRLYNDSEARKHEYGHSVQSRYLGPLYLLVIGLPSLLWAAWHTYGTPRHDYYWFYTEKWANKLGGVK